MNSGGYKLATLILAAMSAILLVFLGLFGFRLLNFNKIKQSEVDKALAKQEKSIKDAYQTEKEKTTTKYTASDIYGNFSFEYPKVWSTNVGQVQGSDPVFRFLADPNLIVVSSSVSYTKVALRVEVNSGSFAQKVKNVESSTNFHNKKLTEEDITISDVKGKKFTGTSEKVPGKKVSFVILPLRERSITITTDDYDAYSKQFQNVLDSFKLSK